MSNILLLPQISGSLKVARNADFRDSIAFRQADETTPLDLTGIGFRMQIRSVADPLTVALEMSVAVDAATGNGLSVARADGLLNFCVLQKAFNDVPAGDYQTDILAFDAAGVLVNLCREGGPMPVTISDGLTR